MVVIWIIGGILVLAWLSIIVVSVGRAWRSWQRSKQDEQDERRIR
jgi:hypothetical protein